MNIIIVGAGIIGQNLAKRLADLKHNVTVIEYEEDVCNELANEFNGSVIHGDATRIEILLESGLKEAQQIVTVMGSDEKNLLVCLIAKEHCPNIKLASRISNEIYRKIFIKSDIHSLISPEMSGVELLEDLITEPDLPEFISNEEGKFELMEIVVGKKSKAVGKTVEALEEEHGTFKIVSREEKESKDFELLSGRSKLQADDKIIAAVYREQEKSFRKLMQ